MEAQMMVNELAQGYGLTRELQAQLNSASVEYCRSLVEEILVSYEKAISMAKSRVLPNLHVESPSSFAESPASRNPEQPFRAERREMVSKKRKTQSRSTSQVKLGSGPEAEGPLEDGYSWRKYGQKEILGAKHPRGYYRCTYRNSQNCLAMKQVQRSDENPLIFHVTYRGAHTCRPKSSPRITPTPSFPKLDHLNPNQNLLLSFQTNLRVQTENLPSSSSFSFPSTPIDNSMDNCFTTNFHGAFISPTTSESNYLSADLSEIVSVATSTTNSPMLDMDFMLDSFQLEQDFPFDACSFVP